MSAGANLLAALLEQVTRNVATAYPATVISYNEGTHEATIQPLQQRKEFNESPKTPSILEGIPVLFFRFRSAPDETEEWGDIFRYKLILKPGDVVWCQVAHRSLDAMMGGSPYYPGSARIMNLQDSIIVGVVKYA